jgi:hypothetical protein
MTTKTVSIIWNRVIDTLPAGHVMEMLATGRALSAYCTIELDSAEWPFVAGADDEQICDSIFHVTNMQEGELWELIESVMPENRSHTSLSVGDQVVVDGEIYTCANFGWKKNDALANFKKSLAF